MKGLQVREGQSGCVFAVHVLPDSGRDGVVGLYGPALRVRLKAPAVEGKANRALQRFLADSLGVPTEAVEILSGHTSRHKVVRVSGVGASRVFALVEERTGRRGEHSRLVR